MAVSEVAICNSALAKLGAARITNLSDDSTEAKLCKEQYDKMRDDVLRAHPWNFAIKRATLAQLSVGPVWDFEFRYALPSDNLRVLNTNLLRNELWAVEGEALVCNSSSVQIRYIAKITDTTKFDTMFDEALALRLAADIAFPLTDSISLAGQMFQLYTQQVALARSADGQVGFSHRQVEANLWSDERF